MRAGEHAQAAKLKELLRAMTNSERKRVSAVLAIRSSFTNAESAGAAPIACGHRGTGAAGYDPKC